MFNRLVNFLDKHNILDNNQASMLITDKIQRAIESKLYSCGIFLDLSKLSLRYSRSQHSLS